MECLMCKAEVDETTLECKGCGLVFKHEGNDIVVDYDNEKTIKALENVEEY